MLTLQKAKEVSAGISDLVELNVKEVSGVDDPAVPLAHFLIIKRDNNGKVKLELTQKGQPMALSYRNLPVSKDRSWDGAAAKASLQAWAKKGNAEGNMDIGKFAQGFLIRDGEHDKVTSYKFPIAKVINGKLVVPFGALVSAAAALKGGRSAGGATLVSEDVRRRAFSNVQKYYRKLNIPKEDIPEFTAKLFIKFNQSDQLEKEKGDRIMALTLTKDLADELKTQLTDISNMLEDGEAKEALISVVDNIAIEKEAQPGQPNDKSIAKSQEEILADIKKDIDTITAKLAELSKGSAPLTSTTSETNGNNGNNDEAWKAMLTELGTMIEQGKLTAEELGQLGSLLTT